MARSAVMLIAVWLSPTATLLAVDHAAEERKRTYTPSPENMAARKWFQDAKFGMFIHWGVYSVLGNGEWVMHKTKMDIEAYEKLPPKFNPTRFDADAWAALAKRAGMRYITITSKHHDGFAMFDSKVSDYDIVDATPYKKDVLKMLAEACARHGLKLCFYHSHLDWHHPDYYPRGRTGQHSGRPDAGEWYRYLDYMDAQIKELCTQYGKIAGFWFDGWWDKKTADWRLGKTYKLIHDLQPQALIGNNHHVLPFPGEDFQMFEKDLPGKNTAGFNKDATIGDLPLETCDTINRAWGYNKNDRKYKSTTQLIHYLVRAAGFNANFLLNVGPKPDGTIQPEFVERLEGIGEWMGKNGETIYGTRGGPFPPAEWGASVHKDGRIFVHVLKWPGAELKLSPVRTRITGARTYAGNKPVKVRQNGGGIILEIPDDARDEVDTIVVLKPGA